MGVLVLFVGLAFLAKYAIDHALFPPELRLAAIGLAGIALFARGFRCVPCCWRECCCWAAWHRRCFASSRHKRLADGVRECHGICVTGGAFRSAGTWVLRAMVESCCRVGG